MSDHHIYGWIGGAPYQPNICLIFYRLSHDHVAICVRGTNVCWFLQTSHYANRYKWPGSCHSLFHINQTCSASCSQLYWHASLSSLSPRGQRELWRLVWPNNKADCRWQHLKKILVVRHVDHLKRWGSWRMNERRSSSAMMQRPRRTVNATIATS